MTCTYWSKSTRTILEGLGIEPYIAGPQFFSSLDYFSLLWYDIITDEHLQYVTSSPKLAQSHSGSLLFVLQFACAHIKPEEPIFLLLFHFRRYSKCKLETKKYREGPGMERSLATACSYQCDWNWHISLPILTNIPVSQFRSSWSPVKRWVKGRIDQ